MVNTNKRVVTINGDRIKAKIAITQSITLGEAWVKNEPIQIIDLPRAFTNPLGNGLSCDGILGISTLADWDVCFNPAKNNLTLYPAGKAPDAQLTHQRPRCTE